MMGLVTFGQGRSEKARLKQTGERIPTAQRIDLTAQRGGPIWSDDFSDPSTWVTDFDATASSLEWEIGMNLGAGGFAPIDTIQSTTQYNGYAMIDSDEYGGENGGTEIEDSWFTTASSIDLSANDNVVLEFESQYYKWTYEECYVVISTNNTDWPELTPDTDISGMDNVFHVWPGMETQDNVDNPTLVRINISEVAGGESTVWVRFHWTGTWGYCWFIDDVAIVPQPSDDIVLESAYVSHNGTGEEYGMIPASQTGQNMLIGSDVYNFGAAAQTNLSWTADFTGPTPFNVSGSLASLESDSTTIFEDATVNSTLAVGTYVGTFEVESDGDNSTGAQFGNNTRTREFMVTESDGGQFAIDGIGVYSNPVVGSLGTNSFTDGADGFMMLAYYNIVGAMAVPSVEILLASTTVPGGTIQVAVHDTADVFGDNVVDPLEQSDAYTITQADVDAGSVTIAFSEAVELEDNAYFVSCEMFSNDGANDIRILDDETVPQPFYCSMIYIPNDQVYSNGTAVGIRINTVSEDPDGVEEIGNLSSLSVSPNPTSGLLTLSLNLDNPTDLNIEVIGVDGATVMTVTEAKANGMLRKQLDMSELANGAYLIKVTSDNGVRTERVMISH